MSKEEIKFFIYCRKSSEDAQKQVASIKDQLDALERVTKGENLKVIGEPFTEEKSSKDPGRPIFNEMLNRVEKGEANAILCWDVDRLYRNPVDEGRLRWMLQKGVIKVIKTPYRQFYPDDAGLLMGVEGGRATDFVIRLSKNVKRGLNGKVRSGWRPSPAPIGYLNVGERGNRTIIKDPERFDLVRKMWDLFLTGTYPVSKIRDIATNEWGLRTVVKRSIGGAPLSLSHIYNIFNESFYYGEFEWENYDTGEKEMYKGQHIPMVTEAEFRRGQILLGKKGKHRSKTREFAFTGVMTCGGCGQGVTAEEKYQVICTNCKSKFSYINKDSCSKCGTSISSMENPKMLHYVYYHHIKKSGNTCNEKGIRLEDLESQFSKILEDITIDQDYLSLALEYLKTKQVGVEKDEEVIRLSLQTAFDKCQKRLANLHREYTSIQNSNYELFSPEEFRLQKQEIVKERNSLEEQLGSAKTKHDKSLVTAERIFNFCTFAANHFNNGDLKKKREIFSSIGSNFVIRDKKLFVDKLHPYLLIENELKAQKILEGSFEHEKTHVKHGFSRTFDLRTNSMLPLVDKFRTLNWKQIQEELEFSELQFSI